MQFNGLGEQQKFHEWIESSHAKVCVDRELYRLKRYGSPVTMGMYRCADPLFEEKFRYYSRKTDHLIPLAEEHFLFLFDHTEISGAIKATENLMLHMELAKEKDRVALTQLREEDSLEAAFKRLLMLFVIASRSKETIVDDSYLMR